MLQRCAADRTLNIQDLCLSVCLVSCRENALVCFVPVLLMNDVEMMDRRWISCLWFEPDENSFCVLLAWLQSVKLAYQGYIDLFCICSGPEIMSLSCVRFLFQWYKMVQDQQKMVLRPAVSTLHVDSPLWWLCRTRSEGPSSETGACDRGHHPTPAVSPAAR